MTPEQERVEREAWSRWFDGFSDEGFNQREIGLTRDAWLARASLEPAPSNTDEDALRDYHHKFLAFDCGEDGACRLEPSDVVNQTWLAACAHKEAQRAGDDLVIRELAEALARLENESRRLINAQFDEGKHLPGLEYAEVRAGHAIKKHATRIAAARSKGEA